MHTSEAFLAIFSEVEKWLRVSAGADKTISFYQLVEVNALSNPIVRRYKDDLKEYADLRNAIVHERSDGHVIAEPNERAVSNFDRIKVALLKPPKVIPQFQMQVRTRASEESIGSALTDMREGSFSQLPVVKSGSVVALLTSETVVRWLASELANDIVSLQETPIHAVLEHVEDEDHYCFLSRNASLHEVITKFEEFTSRGKDLDAILITDSGKPDQKLLGILTVYDLPAILDTLGLRRVAAA
jgi:predicted transcriptional regulator